jgi:S-adenosyl methyltransferase
MDEGIQRYNERSPVKLVPRSRDQINRFLTGLEPVGPGVVPVGQWFERGQLGGDTVDHMGYGGIMRKPRSSLG